MGDIKYLNRGLICTAIHSMVCPCAAFPKSLQDEIDLQIIFNQYQNYTDNLVNSGRYEGIQLLLLDEYFLKVENQLQITFCKQNILGREDFTVVIQPFFKNFRPPRLDTGEIDLSYFAPDCFHLSTKGHGKIIFSYKFK